MESCGFDLLGVDTPLTQQQVLQAAQTTQTSLFDALKAQQQPQPLLNSEQAERARRAMVGTAIGGGVGAVVGAIGIAAAWPAHRVIGVLLGLFVGGPVGAGIGFGVSQAGKK